MRKRIHVRRRLHAREAWKELWLLEGILTHTQHTHTHTHTVKWLWFLVGFVLYVPVVYALLREFRQTVIDKGNQDRRELFEKVGACECGCGCGCVWVWV